MGAAVNKKEHKKHAKKKSDHKQKKESKHALKRKEKEELLSKVPTHDKETGIAYNKAQIRRMLKRIKRGLPPIPTKEELDEIKKEEANIRKEVDNNLIYQDDNGNDDDNDDDDNNGDDNDEEEYEEMEETKNVVSDDEGEVVAKKDIVKETEDINMNNNPESSQDTKKDNNKNTAKQSKKTVPKDYICQACQNKNTPLHWIYNCPDKVTKEGCNQVKKGTFSPNKVYISGLPFDITTKELRMYLKSKCKDDSDGIDGKFIRYCKLLTFKDSKRCNGQAEVIFQNEDITNNCLKLHGTVLDLDNAGNGSNSKKESSSKKRKTLTLSIKKAPPKKNFRKK